MNKTIYLMPETELKAFFDCSKELREAAMTMTPDDVKAHKKEILESAQINEIVDGKLPPLNVGINGAVHIPIQGMLTNHVSPSAGFFGESITTFAFLSESIAQAEASDHVKELVFEINSGGGEVDGLEAVANAIFNTKKPTTAVVHGMAASAAFWLASQTDRIIATGRTSSVGSIGVAAEFIDRSAQDKAEGLKRVILTSTDAPEKRLDITTAAGQKQTVNRLDEIHTVFVDHIVRGISSRHPNVNTEFVNNNFGKGSVMAADAALRVGMIDEIEGVTTQSEVNNEGGTTASEQPTQPTIKEVKKVETLTELLSNNPQAKSEHDILISAAEKAGRDDLRTELKAVSEKVKPIMASDSYTQRIKLAGLEVMSGERTHQSFDDLVALSDELSQKEKSDDIKAEQPEATPTDDGPTAADSAQAEMRAGAEATKNSIGVN